MRKVILIAVILVMLILPVSAYITLADFTTGIATSNDGGSLNGNYFPITVKDYQSFAGNVTKIEMHIFGYKQNNLTFTGSPMLINSPTYGNVGNATVTWTWGPAGTYSGIGDISITIHDIKQVSGMTGIQGLRIGVGAVPVTNWIAMSDPISGAFGSMNNSPYAAKVAWGTFPNGTYKIYGGTPTPPVNTSYGNLTVNVKASGTTTNIGNALVEMYEYGGAGITTGRTNTNGNITFQFAATNATPQNINIFSTGYATYYGTYTLADANAFLQVYLTPQNSPNSTNFMTLNVLDMQTRTYILYNYDLQLFAVNGSTWQNKTGLNGASYITASGSTGTTPLYPGDTYKFYVQSSLYNPGNVTVQYLGSGQVVDLYLNQGGLSNYNNSLYLDIIDGSTGYPIQNAEYSIYDNQSGTWNNNTAPTGAVEVTGVGTGKLYPWTINNYYVESATATGFNRVTKIFKYTMQHADHTRTEVIPLTNLASLPSGYFTQNIYCYDASNNLPLGGVTLITTGSTKTTTNDGYAQFFLNYTGSAYTISGSKSGYKSATVSTGPSPVAGGVYAQSMAMIPGNTYPTATSTTSPSYIGGTGYGFASNGTVATCGNLPANATIFQVMKSNIACWGVEELPMQNLTLAALLALIFILAGARYGKGLGAAAGAVIAFVISLAAGWIPFWVLAALIVVGVLALAILAIFRGNT